MDLNCSLTRTASTLISALVHLVCHTGTEHCCLCYIIWVSRLVIAQVQKEVDISGLLEEANSVLVGVFPEMLDAIKCVRAQGIKTALLTNNWLRKQGTGHSPVDRSLFDVVSFPFLHCACATVTKEGPKRPGPPDAKNFIKNTAFSFPREIEHFDINLLKV